MLVRHCFKHTNCSVQLQQIVSTTVASKVATLLIASSIQL